MSVFLSLDWAVVLDDNLSVLTVGFSSDRPYFVT